MTTGFADWQRTSHVAGTSKKVLNQVIAASVTTGIFFTGDYGYLNVSMETTAAVSHYFVQLFWTTDSLGGTVTVTQSFVTVPFGQMAMQFPVITPWCNIQVTNIEGGADGNVRMDAYGTEAYSPYLGYAEPGDFLLKFRGNLGAGVNQALPATTTYAGPAYLHVNAGTSNGWDAFFTSYDIPTKAFQGYDFWHGADFGQTLADEMRLPPCPVILNITNTSAATQFFRVSVCVGAGF